MFFFLEFTSSTSPKKIFVVISHNALSAASKTTARFFQSFLFITLGLYSSLSRFHDLLSFIRHEHSESKGSSR